MDVILELSKREEVHPVNLPLVDEEAKVLFQLLVDSFRLAVSLWVEGCSRGKLDSKKAVELASKLGYELRSSVRHHSARQAEMPPDMLKEEASGSSSCEGGQGRDEVHSLGD